MSITTSVKCQASSYYVHIDVQGTRNELLSGELRQQLVNAVKPSLHLTQPWFHGNITREEAERILGRSGHEDGKYL